MYEQNGTIPHVIGSIHGTWAAPLVITPGGVGYHVHTPEVIDDGATVTFWTHLAVTDTALTLYGFLRQDDLNVFRWLLGRPGIGAKTALTILTRNTAAAVVSAIAAGPASAAELGGVSANAAVKICAGVKIPPHLTHLIGAEPGPGGAHDELVEALIGLGIAELRAEEAVAAARTEHPNASDGDLLRVALTHGRAS